MRGELTAQVEALLGPKTEADLKPPEKRKKPKADKKAEKQAEPAVAAAAAANGAGNEGTPEVKSA